MPRDSSDLSESARRVFEYLQSETDPIRRTRVAIEKELHLPRHNVITALDELVLSGVVQQEEEWYTLTGIDAETLSLMLKIINRMEDAQSYDEWCQEQALKWLSSSPWKGHVAESLASTLDRIVDVYLEGVFYTQRNAQL